MKRSIRTLVVVGSLGLAAAAVVTAVIGVRMVLDPPPEACPLPLLPVPAGIADFSWSPDGKRLIAATRSGEVWLVHFPEGRAERLPGFPQIVERTGWDRDHRPWLVYPRGLARLRRDGTGWERFVVQLGRARSPDGRWIASVRTLDVRSGGRLRSRRILSVTAAGAPRRRSEARLNAGYRHYLAWLDPGALLIARRGQWQPTPLVYRSGEKRPRELFPTLPTPAGAPEIRYEFRRGPAQSLYAWLLERNVPGLTHRNYGDWRLTVTDAAGRMLENIPVGRRNYPAPGGNFWQSAKLSPDGRFVVLRVPDETLRLLDLKTRR